jgi:hypothetical protein
MRDYRDPGIGPRLRKAVLWIVLVVVAVIMLALGCAVAIGDHSSASVKIDDTTFSRGASAPSIAEVLIQK